MDDVDFGSTFEGLRASGETERHVVLGGVDVRLVRVPGGGPGRWDSHPDAETVVVWSGVFDVAYRDRTVTLGPGQCCVVPIGAEHCGTSKAGAEVVLFRAMTGAAQ